MSYKIQKKNAYKSNSNKNNFYKQNKQIKVEFPHFRKYYKSGHPAMIVGEQRENNFDEWKYKKIMHNVSDGKRNNDMIFPNPDPTDNRPMYVGRRVRHDRKENFSPWTYPWKIKKK